MKRLLSIIVIVLVLGGLWFWSKATVKFVPPKAENTIVIPPLPKITSTPSADTGKPEIMVIRISDQQMTDFAISLQPTEAFRKSAQINQVVRGDLNGDNFSDAVVTMVSCDANCGQSNFILLDENGSPKKALENNFTVSIPVNFGYGAQGPNIKIVSIENGVITVRRFFSTEPAYNLDYKYQLSGGVLVEVVDTTGWQIYRNTKYGFEFEHPSNLAPFVGFSGESFIKATPVTDIVRISPRVEVGKSVPGTELASLEIKVQSGVVNQVPKNKNTQSVILAGEPAELILGGGNLDSNFKTIYVSHEGYSFVILQNAVNPTLDQILATFRFTK